MTIQLKRILLPTDFSQYAATAAKYACELATRFDAELHVLPPAPCCPCGPKDISS